MHFRLRRRRMGAAAVSSAAILALAACSTTTGQEITGTPDTLWQQARVIKEGKPWVVGLGDSFMSGEAGRWASNGVDNADIKLNGGWLVGTPSQVYGDNVDYSEKVPYCHRSATAPMFTGADVNHLNLACSGAQTNSFVNQYGRAKPGVDFKTVTSSSGQRVPGQAAALQEFARAHRVQTVMLSIGGNDLGFSEIITNCVSDWIVGTPCRTSDFIASRVNPAVKRLLINRIRGAIENINRAMRSAGYGRNEWRLIVQLPPSPVPNSKDIEYADFAFDRQLFGGCGLLNSDLDFANDTLLPYLESAVTGAVRAARSQADNAPITVVDMKNALNGHRLCETGTTRPAAGTGIPPDGFGANVEWVRFISILAAKAEPESDDAQEAMHPNYFGQRALASCMTLAIQTEASTQRVGCTLDSPLAFGAQALPNMKLTPS